MYLYEVYVFSFAIVCSKILSKRDPIDGVFLKRETLERIQKYERPKLSSNYHELKKLIEECWNWNTSYYSNFANICIRFIILKKKILVEYCLNNLLSFL